MKNDILITPAQAMQLRVKPDIYMLEWARVMASFYGARPRKGNEDAVYTFIADVFRAGRISGIREERRRRRK